jgi:hypothetical protein
MRIIAFHNNLGVKLSAQPLWLTELIHEWYPSVPERTGKYPNMVADFSGLPRILQQDSAFNAEQLTFDASPLSAVLDVWKPDNHRLPRRYRREFNRVEYRILAVVPKGVKYPKDRWSQVLRALVNPRVDQEFGWDALAKRVSYKYRWAALR